VSEYGFQSYPDSSHLARYIPPEQLHIGSPALSYRQRSYRTDRPIWDAIRHELGMVPTSLGGFISASQQVQAKAYERGDHRTLESLARMHGHLALAAE
jgi:hypothetical protein